MSGTLLGSYYVFMLVGIMIHEAAHGLAAEAVGGTWVAFDINPGLGGWAWHRGVPEEKVDHIPGGKLSLEVGHLTLRDLKLREAEAAFGMYAHTGREGRSLFHYPKWLA